MKFVLVDRIIHCEPGRRIRTVKALSLAEEYLADHFPTFPVLPGVLMLEGLTQSAAWLVRTTLDFEPSLIELRQVRNVIYKNFVRPGEVLEMEVQAKRLDRNSSEFTGVGSCSGKEAVKARFTLVHSRLSDEHPEGAELDLNLGVQARAMYKLLGGPAAEGVELAGYRG